MQFVTFLCVLLVAVVLVTSVDSRKTFSSRRKSGGSNRRGGSTSFKQKPPPPVQTPPHKTDSVNTNFLNSERVASTNTHHRGNPFNNQPHPQPQPQAPKQPVPQNNGPIGFEKINNPANQKLGFDKVNSEVQHKPSAPAYPVAPPSYPGNSGKPLASAPNGPPPAYPGYAPPNAAGGTHTGGFEPPPAYPGRPVNAPPVYSPNNPNIGQNNPVQPGFGGYPNQQGNFHNQQNGYPHQGSYSGQSYPGQQNYGYPNTGNSFGNYPNQGVGSHPSGGFGSSYPGGFAQSYPGGTPYGGSPFGHSNSYSGSPFGSSGFGGNSFGGFGGGHNPNYSPNNFGYSSNPGLFGNSPYPGYSGNHNNFGYHKKSRFGGLPIPIPIPIPIPLGMFGGFGGGHSYNHRLLNTFIKNQTINTSDNTTTSVFILNNATVTPCTTDQFIYNLLNVTVMSCTAENCTAIKIYTTTNVSGEVAVHSAGITMCLEPNATYSSFSENVNPTISDVHSYWMRVCKEVVAANVTGNLTDQGAENLTVKVSDTTINETVIGQNNTTPDTVTNSSASVETSILPSLGNHTITPISTDSNNSTAFNSTGNNNSSNCETFDCSWIEMCLPAIEIVDRCSTNASECPFTRTGYQPCVRIKMCKSPTTPMSTFATLNTTISRIDQFNNITSVNDIANLTLISYIPLKLPTNCSQNATDPGCLPPPITLTEEPCVPSNSTEAHTADESLASTNGTVCIPPFVPETANSTGADLTTTTASSITLTR